MNNYLQSAKAYTQTYKKELIIGTSVILALLVLITAIVIMYINSTPKVVYQPAKACDLFSSVEAKELLGASMIKSEEKDPVQSADTATSQCGYTDGNPNTDNMIVAAIIVRSGINDKGVEQNKNQFNAGKPTKDVEVVKDLGDSAYFNQVRGQLNILNDREWIILSYGVGSSPEANTVDKAVEFARSILN